MKRRRVRGVDTGTVFVGKNEQAEGCYIEIVDGSDIACAGLFLPQLDQLITALQKARKEIAPSTEEIFADLKEGGEPVEPDETTKHLQTFL